MVCETLESNPKFIMCDKFKGFQILVENESGKKIKVIQCDGRG
jgi:hypothetical protein